MCMCERETETERKRCRDRSKDIIELLKARPRMNTFNHSGGAGDRQRKNEIKTVSYPNQNLEEIELAKKLRRCCGHCCLLIVGIISRHSLAISYLVLDYIAKSGRSKKSGVYCTGKETGRQKISNYMLLRKFTSVLCE